MPLSPCQEIISQITLPLHEALFHLHQAQAIAERRIFTSVKYTKPGILEVRYQLTRVNGQLHRIQDLAKTGLRARPAIQPELEESPF